MYFLRYPAPSTTAQFNLGKLLLRYRRTEPPRAGATTVSRRRSEAAGDDVREAKRLLQKVIRDNEEHSGARLCLAQALAEEGGAATAACTIVLGALRRRYVFPIP